MEANVGQIKTIVRGGTSTDDVDLTTTVGTISTITFDDVGFFEHLCGQEQVDG